MPKKTEVELGDDICFPEPTGEELEKMESDKRNHLRLESINTIPKITDEEKQKIKSFCFGHLGITEKKDVFPIVKTNKLDAMIQMYEKVHSSDFIKIDNFIFENYKLDSASNSAIKKNQLVKQVKYIFLLNEYNNSNLEEVFQLMKDAKKCGFLDKKYKMSENIKEAFTTSISIDDKGEWLFENIKYANEIKILKKMERDNPGSVMPKITALKAMLLATEGDIQDLRNLIEITQLMNESFNQPTFTNEEATKNMIDYIQKYFIIDSEFNVTEKEFITEYPEMVQAIEEAEELQNKNSIMSSMKQYAEATPQEIISYQDIHDSMNILQNIGLVIDTKRNFFPFIHKKQINTTIRKYKNSSKEKADQVENIMKTIRKKNKGENFSQLQLELAVHLLHLYKGKDKQLFNRLQSFITDAPHLRFTNSDNSMQRTFVAQFKRTSETRDKEEKAQKSIWQKMKENEDERAKIINTLSLLDTAVDEEEAYINLLSAKERSPDDYIEQRNITKEFVSFLYKNVQYDYGVFTELTRTKIKEFIENFLMGKTMEIDADTILNNMQQYLEEPESYASIKDINVAMTLLRNAQIIVKKQEKVDTKLFELESPLEFLKLYDSCAIITSKNY